MPGKWQGSQRRFRLPKNWAELVATVHRRSGMRCEFVLPSGRRCPRRATGGVDHIIPNDDHSLSNLRDSCQHHHGRKSSAEGAAAKAEYLRPVNPPERHPRSKG
jgi:hypothetical protein